MAKPISRATARVIFIRLMVPKLTFAPAQELLGLTLTLL